MCHILYLIIVQIIPTRGQLKYFFLKKTRLQSALDLCFQNGIQNLKIFQFPQIIQNEFQFLKIFKIHILGAYNYALYRVKCLSQTNLCTQRASKGRRRAVGAQHLSFESFQILKIILNNLKSFWILNSIFPF